MTGKYPIHTGMQHRVLYGAEPRGLPLSEKIMPEYFNELGYSSHIAGKWHLGHYKRVYTPLYRGFQSHVGCFTGHHDYFDHTAVENPSWGLDMRNGLDVAYDLHGKYSTDIITDEAVQVIRKRNSSMPLFMYVAHVAVHSGNPYNPLPAPDDAVSRIKNISDYNRRKYAAMLSKLDDSVGTIVNELHKHNMLSNSIIIFSTDNGGPAEGFNLNHASNWPLRGVKNTLWEGGVRGAGLIWSPRLQKTQRVSEQTMQIADWIPTLLTAIGDPLNQTNVKIDGISIWNELSLNEESKRKKILHNIDDILGSASITVGDWKIHKGTNYQGAWDGWYGPPGTRDEKSYNISAVLNCPAGRAIASIKMMPNAQKITQIRRDATVNCKTNEIDKTSAAKGVPCEPLVAPCLFNIKQDPCEHVNLAEKYPNILKALLDELDAHNATAVPPSNKPMDSRADPRFWDNTWTNFGDFSVEKIFNWIG